MRFYFNYHCIKDEPQQSFLFPFQCFTTALGVDWKSLTKGEIASYFVSFTSIRTQIEPFVRILAPVRLGSPQINRCFATAVATSTVVSVG
jgi:hypothetical protein